MEDIHVVGEKMATNGHKTDIKAVANFGDQSLCTSIWRLYGHNMLKIPYRIFPFVDVLFNPMLYKICPFSRPWKSHAQKSRTDSTPRVLTLDSDQTFCWLEYFSSNQREMQVIRGHHQKQPAARCFNSSKKTTLYYSYCALLIEPHYAMYNTANCTMHKK